MNKKEEPSGEPANCCMSRSLLYYKDYCRVITHRHFIWLDWTGLEELRCAMDCMATTLLISLWAPMNLTKETHYRSKKKKFSPLQNQCNPLCSNVFLHGICLKRQIALQVLVLGLLLFQIPSPPPLYYSSDLPSAVVQLCCGAERTTLGIRDFFIFF